MDLTQAKTDPGSQFKHPREVLALTEIDTQQKIAILKQWNYDLREMMVAEEENMLPDNSSDNAELFREVCKALEEIEGEDGGDNNQGADTSEGGAPTKQG